MRTVGPWMMYMAAIVVVICVLFWVAALFLAYVADDWGTPEASERSVPRPMTY